LVALASRTKAPLAGKDLKTGQTLIKTIIAPGLKARLLGVQGWYSTNILGNRDGEVLDDPESFKTKEESKKSVLDYILQPQLYPDLYKDLCHFVRINYYPPRGDNKEALDANTTTSAKAPYGQPALIGGLVMGVLSALPLVNAANICCCLWVIAGGAVAAYLLQQNQTMPIAPGDGALVGLFAGIIGAFV